MARTLYLICYDIADSKRLYHIHRQVQAFAIGGQKSCYECWLTPAEFSDLCSNLVRIMHEQEDRIHVFQLDPRMTPFFCGKAQRQSAAPFLIV